jgi:hypothetical protein
MRRSFFPLNFRSAAFQAAAISETVLEELWAMACHDPGIPGTGGGVSSSIERLVRSQAPVQPRLVDCISGIFYYQRCFIVGGWVDLRRRGFSTS